MSRGDWESHKLLFGEENRLKPCPFCGSEPYVDSCDRIIDIGCDKCGYHRHFHGLVQDEIETDVVASRYKDSRKAYEWYDKDAYQKAAAGWNERSNRLDEICENYGLTPYGVEFALEQYQKVIGEITHGMMSKLNYYAKDILQMAQERWCETCDLKTDGPSTFHVIDTKTGDEADIERIARREKWAAGLIYCDMEGWAVEDDGSLLLMDECGNFKYADRERFKVVWDE